MISGIDLNETIDFVSQFDKGEDKTIFRIGAVSSKVQARIGRLVGIDGNGSIEAMAEAFRFGVKGIVNFSTKNVPVLFETTALSLDGSAHQVVSNKIMDILPIKVILEVGAKVLSISNMSEQEEKN
jgi:hypothetical protein